MYSFRRRVKYTEFEQYYQDVCLLLLKMFLKASLLPLSQNSSYPSDVFRNDPSSLFLYFFFFFLFSFMPGISHSVYSSNVFGVPEVCDEVLQETERGETRRNWNSMNSLLPNGKQSFSQSSDFPSLASSCQLQILLGWILMACECLWAHRSI